MLQKIRILKFIMAALADRSSFHVWNI